MYWVLDIDPLTYSLQPACKVHILFSTLYSRKGKLRAVKAQDPMPNKQQSQGWIPPESIFIS